jgi:hypothetical protein
MMDGTSKEMAVTSSEVFDIKLNDLHYLICALSLAAPSHGHFPFPQEGSASGASADSADRMACPAQARLALWRFCQVWTSD